MRIVVDAMGGDHAPACVVAGVVEAVKELPVHITLVGIQEQVTKELSQYSYPKDRIIVHHASEVVDMEDKPLDVIRKKKGCSIAVGINLLKEPGYDAFVSAGNTGALVAAATFYLRMIEGVDRPGIGLVIPQVNGCAFLIDVGANPDPKPEHIYQYGLMARVYMQTVIGIENPTVGLINIGEEEGKGSGFDKQTYQLLQEKMPGFIGNVEPNKLFGSKGAITRVQVEKAELDWEDVSAKLINNGWADEISSSEVELKTNWGQKQNSMAKVFGSEFPKMLPILQQHRKVDCLICTGVVGNVIIKLSEGLMEAAGTVLKRGIMKDPLAMLGGLLMKGSLRGLKKHVDYSEYGGAPLLGVNGIVMKSHGRSSPKAIKNAIRAAMREVEHKVLDKMRTAVVG